MQYMKYMQDMHTMHNMYNMHNLRYTCTKRAHMYEQNVPINNSVTERPGRPGPAARRAATDWLCLCRRSRLCQ
jgi:hypothetical protein